MAPTAGLLLRAAGALGCLLSMTNLLAPSIPLADATAFLPPSSGAAAPSSITTLIKGRVSQQHQQLLLSRRQRRAGEGASPSSVVQLGFKAGDSYDVYKDLPRDKVDEIEEPAARDMLQRMQSWEVPVPTEVAESKRVYVTGVGPRAGPLRGGAKGLETPAVVLLHGFDSSCLEFRRLQPLLEEQGEVDVFALDVLGWGFSQLDGVRSFSASAKRAYLHSFWTNVLNKRPMVLLGASLGGAIAIDFTHAYPEAVDKLVFVNPQAWIDGLGGMASLPRPLAKLGINVLKSVPLRAYAGRLSYHDPDRYSTEDAMRIGRLHCLREGWEDASVDYMLSGGYTTTQKVAVLASKAVLVLWGRQDRILEPSVAQRFRDELPSARLAYVEDCGHVAHLEKPGAAAKAILDFVLLNKWQPGQDGGVLNCVECSDEKVVACPNCDGQGWYEAYGRRVDCKSCRTTGLVICRSCYKGDPMDVEAIRDTVRDAAQRLGRPPPKVMM